MSSDTITLELDKYESGVVFHSLKDKRNQMLKLNMKNMMESSIT